MKYYFCLFFLPILLVSCATPDQPAQMRYGVPDQGSPSLKPSRQQPPLALQGTTRTQRLRGAGSSLATAVSAPLDDFNIRRPIAPLALEDMGYIYRAPPRHDCTGVSYQLRVLEIALNELDADDIAIEKSKNRQRAEMAGNTTLDAVRSVSSGLIPFSGVIRTASGAKAAREHYEEKFDHGRRRRAFLKGYALGIGCAPPVSPKTLIGPPPSSQRQATDKRDKSSRRRGNH